MECARPHLPRTGAGRAFPEEGGGRRARQGEKRVEPREAHGSQDGGGKQAVRGSEGFDQECAVSRKSPEDLRG
ncbi:hypothetical protein SDC9_182597 [bioreactor metagenome]|uniref:Uncharacterized protein n=1 Tax=bioreactor metagenome TaxID=1076179 RepID=A0A645H9P7_9ZZZZ